jgi:hypothetical protein
LLCAIRAAAELRSARSVSRVALQRAG